jgi:hypothetical protein
MDSGLEYSPLVGRESAVASNAPNVQKSRNDPRTEVCRTFPVSTVARARRHFGASFAPSGQRALNLLHFIEPFVLGHLTTQCSGGGRTRQHMGLRTDDVHS